MKNMALLSLSLLYWLVLFYSQQQGHISDVVFYALIACNALSVIFYGMDKLAAMKQWQRTPEKHFYLLAVCGGWPGSIIGQMIFHHKTSKVSFRRWFYAMMLLNISMLSGYLLKLNGLLPG